MRTYLASTIGALVLLVLARFHHAAASPIPMSSPGSVPSEYLLSFDSSDVSHNLRPISPGVAWNAVVNMPSMSVPEGTKLNLYIPKSDEGIESVVNIVGLMRTVPSDDNSANALGVWICKLKKKNILGEKKIPPGFKGKKRRGERPKRLQGDELRNRKILIASVVEAHNNRKWYKPTGQMKTDIDNRLKHSSIHPGSGSNDLASSQTPSQLMPKISAMGHDGQHHTLSSPAHSSQSSEATVCHGPGESEYFDDAFWTFDCDGKEERHPV